MPVQLLPLLVLPPPMMIMILADHGDDINDNDCDDADDQDVIDG